MRLAASCDIGLSWRDASLDASLELSTKVLEFGLLGLPVILNRTPMHEGLLGADYPLFARDLSDVADTAAEVASDPAVARLAAARTAAAVAVLSTLESAGPGPGPAAYLDRGHRRQRTASPAPGAGQRRATAGRRGRPRPEVLRPHSGLPQRPARAGSAGGPLAGPRQALRRGQHGPRPWADVVICEWCGPNAIWYSRHKRRGSRLIVRLHRFELSAGYANLVNIKAIDQVVCVEPALCPAVP